MSPLYRNNIDLDWMTLILMISLVLISLGKYFFSTSFSNFIILPFNNKYITLNKKKDKILQGFHIIMSLFQILNLALFCFVARNVIRENSFGAYTEFYFIIIVGLVLFFLFKILLQIASGYFFENQELVNKLIFEKLTYFNYGGFVAFLGNILAIYIFPNAAAVIYVIILLLLVVNGIGIVRILRNHQKLIIGNTFYFILYLCTLEISPIAIIISYLNS